MRVLAVPEAVLTNFVLRVSTPSEYFIFLNDNLGTFLSSFYLGYCVLSSSALHHLEHYCIKRSTCGSLVKVLMFLSWRFKRRLLKWWLSALETLYLPRYPLLFSAGCFIHNTAITHTWIVHWDVQTREVHQNDTEMIAVLLSECLGLLQPDDQ